MERFGNGGSLILVASIAGHVSVVSLALYPRSLQSCASYHTTPLTEPRHHSLRDRKKRCTPDGAEPRVRARPEGHPGQYDQSWVFSVPVRAPYLRQYRNTPNLAVRSMLDQLFKERPDWGHILTNANPMKRVGEGRELRGAIVWLASDASSFCTGSEYVSVVPSGSVYADARHHSAL